MASVNYTVLTENNDYQSLDSPAQSAYDASGGIDTLSLSWRYVEMSQGNNYPPAGTGMTFSVKKNDGSWVQFGSGGGGEGNVQPLTFNAIHSALAASSGEFKYSTSANNWVYYKNFELMNIDAADTDDVIVFHPLHSISLPNSNYPLQLPTQLNYSGGEGTDTFYAVLSGSQAMTRLTNGGGTLIIPHDYIWYDGEHPAPGNWTLTANISGMERLLLKLGDDYNYINHQEIATDNEVYGGKKNDQLIFGDGKDILHGGRGHDLIYGGGGDDVLHGNEGADRLNGGAGADTMNGGLGNDLFMVDNAGDKVVEQANEGIDTVLAMRSYDLRSTPNVENVILYGDNHEVPPELGNALSLLMEYDLPDNNFNLETIVNLHGNALNNELFGNQNNNVINGDAGNDTIYGVEGNDTLDGGTGADVMYGGVGDDKFHVDNAGDKVIEYVNEGRDTVFSTINYDLSKAEHIHIENAVLLGTGNLTLQGNGEGNLLKGNAGDNHLKGLGGNDWLEGGAGNDILNGNAGADRMIGGAGNDVYYADSKSDVVVETAGGGRDTVNVSFDYDLLKVAHIENAIAIGAGHIKLQGSGEGNLLKGNAGNNQLNGLGGNDWLEGGAGNDVLVGGSGRDVLVGGAGNDTFKFGGVNDSTLTLKDVINDFTRGQDKIDLSAIDANTTQAGNQAFSFIGSGNFSKAGQVRFAGGVVSGDVNGDKVADFAIEVKNVTTLQASDFIL